MSITYPLSLPSVSGPKSINWKLTSAVGVLASPFTMKTYVQAHAGARWSADINIPSNPIADAAPWRAFFAQLNGMEGTFLLGDSSHSTPLGAATGTPLVNGASQTGQSLVTDGWTTGVTGILKAGDWIQLGSGATSRLYMVLNDVNSDGSGNATIDIAPRLRESPADNAVITTSNPKGLFRLSRNVSGIFSASGAKLSSFSFSAVEAI